MSNFMFLGVFFIFFIYVCGAILHEGNYPTPVANEDQEYWTSLGSSEINSSLNQTPSNTNKAKNVIIFLGDGMGFQTIMPSRIYKGQLQGVSGEEGFLSFEEFPNVALLKTYCVDYQVTDSASSGTAYLSGVKANKRTLGVDKNVQKGDCTTMKEEYNVYSIAKWSQDAGKRTGVVTTTRVTHATPGSLYAHTADRDWEVDSALPENWKDSCPELKDVARQLVEDSPGKQLNVVMGGGYQVLNSDATDNPGDPVSEWTGTRADGRNLIDEWLEAKLENNETASVVRNRTQLMNLNLNDTDFVLGIYANDHLPYAYETREQHLDIPTLAEMTETAIKLLDKSEEGYFLLVEGGKIDWAHHYGIAKTALDETVDFDNAITAALELVNLEETLFIVTADHSHTLSVAGYPSRGNPITGLSAVDGSDSIPYTSLLYGTSPGGWNFTISEDNKVERQDPSLEDLENFQYIQQAAVPLYSSAHGGEDVPIYATGPWSHLFYSTHEQVFVANVMAYASCVGRYQDPCLASSSNIKKNSSNFAEGKKIKE